MNLNFHPAPGFGELLPGFFVVPQNPIDGNSGPGGMAGVRYIPRIGELLPARFTVPQNPLISTLRTGIKGMRGCTGSGMGDGSGGANPSDTGTGYINGVAVPGLDSLGEQFGQVNWITVAIAVAVGYAISKA